MKMQMDKILGCVGREGPARPGIRMATLYLSLFVLTSAPGGADTAKAEVPPSPGAIRSVAYHPGGKLLASGGDDTVVKLWDTQTGKMTRYLIGHTEAVRSVAFSPDGKTLASRSADGTVILWNAESGARLQTFSVASPRASVLVFSPDSHLLAMDGADFSVVLLDATTGKTLNTLKSHTGYVTCAAFSPDGTLLATGSSDKTLRVWETATGTLRHTLKRPSGWIDAVAFDPKSAALASGGDDGKVALWDLAAEKVAKELSGHAGFVNGIAFRPDGQEIAAAGADDTVRLWNVASGKETQRFHGPPGWWSSVTFSPDGATLAAGHSANRVQLWSLANPNTPVVLQTPAGEPRILAALWNRQGMTARRLTFGGDYLLAIDCFRHAAALDAAEPAYLARQANAHADAWQFAEAVTLLEARLPQFTGASDRQTLQAALADAQSAWAWYLWQKRLYTEAIAHYQAAYDIDKGFRLPTAGDQLGSIASCYWALNRPDQARAFYEQQIDVRRQTGDQKKEGDALDNLAGLYCAICRYEKALEYFSLALAQRSAVKDERGEGVSLNNMANVYTDLGQYAKALDLYQQALAVHHRMQERSQEAVETENIGAVYARMGQHTRALGFFEQALQIARETKSRSTESRILSLMAASYDALGQHARALAVCTDAQNIAQALGEKAAYIPLQLGIIYLSLQQPAKAQEVLESALTLARQSKFPDTEARVLYQLMRTETGLQQPRLAIFYGKQAVNRYQEIRGFLQSLDKEFKKSFVDSKQPTYRELADLLITQGRLPEAEQVLGMLKEEEFFDFVRRDQDQEKTLNGPIGYSPTEAEWEKRYREISDQITEIGLEYDVLKAKEGRTPEEERKLAGLQHDVVVANEAFRKFLGDLRQQFANPQVARETVVQLKASSGLQTALHELGAGTVALYTLVADKAYRVILVTPSTQKAAEYPITAAELNKKVLAFRDVLKDPRLDPRPLAQELYKILIGPIAKDLDNASTPNIKIQTLMWSLDGVLRYIPLGALYDGKQYLVQRYRQSVFTTESLPYIKDVPSAQWHALGLGVSRAYEGFSALPGVADELHGIIADDNRPGKKGILPGTVKLDDGFTEAFLFGELSHPKRWPLVHIASHFQFQTGDETHSFLLLGDGTHLSLDRIETMPDLFSGVELLTLSACDTATGVSAGDTRAPDGKEIDSFGMLAQSKGAAAVVATLWPVADKSTPLLMQKFYEARTTHPGMTKGEALRVAQLALLTGPEDPKAQTATPPRGTEPVPGQGAAGQPRFTPDPKAPYAHPYYWAPFILIGNWR